MNDIPFVRDMQVHYGACEELAPGLRRVLARNPGPFTFHGSGAFIVGRGTVAVIDPGPPSGEHVDNIVAALGGERVAAILVTHAHADHAPAAPMLAAKVDAPVLAYDPACTDLDMRPDADRDGAEVEEGVDFGFRPDETIGEGCRTEVEGPDGESWSLEALHTPGHTGDHLCFALDAGRQLFTGDHVMGWSTTVVSPPQGNMGDYMRSLRRVLERGDSILRPCHGPPVTKPKHFLRALIRHRRRREASILAALEAGRSAIPDIVAREYPDLDPRLIHAAGRSVLAHLLDLEARGEAERVDETGALWRRT